MRNNKGFTLVELMVVMAIIAILATAGITQYTSFIKNARDTTRLTDVKAIETIVTAEMAATGSAPSNGQIQKILKEKAGKTFKDPSTGTKACFNGGENPTAGTCEYQYAQCDLGGGYIIRFQFEDSSKVAKYSADDYGGTAPTTDNHYDVGSCVEDYPVDSKFVAIDGTNESGSTTE